MSRIVETRLERVVVPFRAPVVTTERTWRERRLGIVVLVDEAGSTGLGELALDRDDGSSAAALALDRLSHLAGQEAVEALEGGLQTGSTDEPVGPGRTGSGGAVDHVVSGAIQSAALDLLARAAGRPLWFELVDRAAGADPTMLGRPGPDGAPAAADPPTVAVNALVLGRSIEAATRAAVAAVAAGFGTLKLKTAPDESCRALVERVGAVRDAVGSEVRLRLDANGGWTVDDAIDRLRALSGLDLEYVEQPIPARLGSSALARVRRGSSVPVAADESVSDRAAAGRLLDAHAVDVLVVKPSRVGGPLTAARLARSAADRGVATVVSTLFETGVGIAAALQVALVVPGPARAHGLATADLLADDLVTDPLSVRGGRLAAPGGPGLGVVLDQAALEVFRVP